MLTHSDHPRVLEHLERLRREAALPTFRARHSAHDHAESSADISVSDADMERILPNRFAIKTSLRRGVANGFVDIFHVAVSRSSLLAGFNYIWMIEYDVDYAGPWQEVFVAYAQSKADLLAYRVRDEQMYPQWYHWKGLRTPSLYRWSAFLPIVRFSDAFLRAYAAAAERGEWLGHYEGLMPTLAAGDDRFALEEFSGEGPFALAGRRRILTAESFGYRPSRSETYFHEDPSAFPEKRLLYHPVKPSLATDSQP